MKKEQLAQRLGAAGAEAVFASSPEEYGAYVRGEVARWGKVIKASGLVTHQN
jgi:tripartite-type tricarboxylate transporter receptor subunit TctC